MVSRRYQVKPRGVPKSAYLAEQERRKDEAEKKKDDEDDAENDAETVQAPGPDDDGPEPPKQLHAWVMLRGFKRDVKEKTFVEPTTGRFYPVADSPYGRTERRSLSR